MTKHKEFLVNHDGKWTLQLLDSDTEENSYRVAVPSGADFLTQKLKGDKFFWADGGRLWFGSKFNKWVELVSMQDHLEKLNHELLWQRSEIEPLSDQYAEIEKARQDTIKVTIDELKHRVGFEPNKKTVDAMKEADAMFGDAVNNPSHYSDSIIECIDAMEAMLSPQEFIGYLRGNVFKYQWRYQKKNGIEDLQKSEWYLKKLIEKEMKNEDE